MAPNACESDGECTRVVNAFEQWFHPIVSQPRDATMLCFPYSGSGASMFAQWRNEFIDGVGLYAARMPGRESRLKEPPLGDLLEAADVISAAVADSDRCQGRLFLVGFSLGGLLAFEVARALRRRGRSTDLIVAGAARAPQGRWSRGNLHRLPDDRFLKRLNELYGAVPQTVIDNPELLRLLLPMLRADITMFETYRYQTEPPLGCQIVTMLGTEDSMVKPKHVYPWRELGASFRHRSFSGNHYFVRTNRSAVVEAINGRVRRYL